MGFFECSQRESGLFTKKKTNKQINFPEGRRLGAGGDATPPPPPRPAAPYRLTPDDLAARREVFDQPAPPLPHRRRQSSTAYRMLGEGVASQPHTQRVWAPRVVPLEVFAPAPSAYRMLGEGIASQRQQSHRQRVWAVPLQRDLMIAMFLQMGMFHTPPPMMPMTFEYLVDLDPVRVGVTPETLARATTECVISAPTTGEEEPSTCVVCQAGMVVGERARTLPCRHQYHTECIDQWLGAHKTCPVCKAEVKAAVSSP